MLGLLLRVIRNHFDEQGQPYLSILYQTIFSTAYFGLFRIGELADSEHTIRASDMHVRANKRKMMFVLHSSKMHGKSAKPQIVKISSKSGGAKTRNFNPEQELLTCPYELLRQYAALQGPYANPKNKHFFIFSDGTTVKQNQVRRCLKKMLKLANFNHNNYSFHSLRAGRTHDLLKCGLSIETIKKLGRWCSNAVYQYLKY